MSSDTAERERMLSPSAALNRFNPPVGATIGGARPAPQQAKPTRFGFRVGDLRLLIRSDILSEVMTQVAIYPVPNVPAWFLGLINLRGNLLPVFDLHQLLGSESSAPSNKKTVLILDQGRNAVGVAIDGLPQSVALDRQLRNVPPVHDLLEKHVSTAYITPGGIWLEFDHIGFFSALGEQIAS